MKNRARYRFLSVLFLSVSFLATFSAFHFFSINNHKRHNQEISGIFLTASAVKEKDGSPKNSKLQLNANGHGVLYSSWFGAGSRIRRHPLSIDKEDEAIEIEHVEGHREASIADEGEVDLPVQAATPSKVIECRDFHNIANLTDVCSFVLNNSDCDIDQGFINYNAVIYCKFSIVPLAVVILFFWWLFLFAGLATTADSYFCPSLAVISKTLRLSQNIAGVTLLAFGNGAPDIFSAISAIGNAKDGEAGLAIGALIGAAIFLTTIVAGAVTLTSPFVAMERPLLRDIIFFLGAVFWTFTVLYKGYITTPESAGFIALYVVYVLTVIISRAIRQSLKIRAERQKEDQAKLTEDDSLDRDDQNSVPYLSVQDTDEGNEISGHSSGNVQSIPTIAIRTPDLELDENHRLSVSPVPRAPSPTPIAKKGSTITGLARIAEAVGVSSVFGSEVLSNATLLPQDQPSVMEGSQTELDSNFLSSANVGLISSEQNTGPKAIFLGFLKALCPIDIKNWSDLSYFWRFFEFFKCPLVLCLNLTMPVVDFDEDMHNWNKVLNSLNCIVAPLFCVFAANAAMTNIGGVLPVWGLVLMIGFSFSLLVFATSSHTEQPKYHWVFAYVAFIVSIFWIYTIANEIVNLLQSFGVVFNISDAVLGLTLLAWGNSIGDLISDTVSARQGFPRMAISACFGGPLFNILLGIGLPFTIATIKSGGRYDIKFSFIQMILCGFLALSLLSTLIIMPLRKFHFTRGYGIYLIILYGIFLVVALLTETKVINVPR
ncbi:mitochondrial sodium/calcium exchanger protein-like [Lineus longissimus]|uniref:mitochondrial sodium/calcium exchanger protein-like n=1 Tax=Lineus longissimus TaxID=88925 RepID=UPI00315C7E97